MGVKTTKQVRTSELPTDLLDKAMIWGLKREPPLRTKTEVLTELLKRGLKNGR